MSGYGDDRAKEHSRRLRRNVAYVLFLILLIVSTAWAVRHALMGGARFSDEFRRGVLLVAEFPSSVKEAYRTLAGWMKGEPVILLIDRESVERPNWERSFPSADDPGYLLFSGVYRGESEASVRLIRITDGKSLSVWRPDWASIAGQINASRGGSQVAPDALRAKHPLLLDDGSIVFVVGGPRQGPLVRIAGCSEKTSKSRTLWLRAGRYHHSVELSEDGKSVWVPAVASSDAVPNKWLEKRLVNDSLDQVTIEGAHVASIPFYSLLASSGLLPMAFGVSGVIFNDDPFHINQISVAQADGEAWTRGDLLVSARNISTVFLVRPSTREVLWHRQGPWMNQHSARFVDSSRISVFDNNVFGGAPQSSPFLQLGDMNRVWLYDFKDGVLTQPFRELLEKARPVTVFQGLARVLDDGGLFLEETETGRHLRFSAERLLWSRVNDYDERRIGALAWSRYLGAGEISSALRSFRLAGCVAD